MQNMNKPFSLASLVEYQDSAIVSNTIVKKDTGTVTLFAFDTGQALSEHTTPFDAMVQVLDGELEIRLSGTPHTVAAGASIIMPANEPHALKAAKPSKMLITMLKS